MQSRLPDALIRRHVGILVFAIGPAGSGLAWAENGGKMTVGNAGRNSQPSAVYTEYSILMTTSPRSGCARDRRTGATDGPVTVTAPGSVLGCADGSRAGQRYGESREAGERVRCPVAAGRAMGGKHEVPGTDMFMAVVIFALIAVLGIVITLALLGVGG